MLLALLVLGIGIQSLAQAPVLIVSGSVKEGWKNLNGANLTISKNGSQVSSGSLTTGKFEHPFEVNSKYLMEFSMAGYVSKKIEFITAVPATATESWEFDFVVELFKDQNGLDKAVFLNPVAKVRYEESNKDFDYDLDYTMEFQRKRPLRNLRNSKK